MPLLLLDLDNTFVDRDAAFRAAVADFLAEHDLPSSELAWVMVVDASGYTPRYDVAATLSGHYGDVVPTAAVRIRPDDSAGDRSQGTHATRLTNPVHAGPWPEHDLPR
ncbi:hypothetical protein [Streptomyces sviceus]|uniref:hypothetical protein n=1 Tax=Streptomyces sviceus TaxID=285530 RepID=UPI0033204620